VSAGTLAASWTSCCWSSSEAACRDARRSTASRDVKVAHRSATIPPARKNSSPCTGGSGAALADWIPFCSLVALKSASFA
jgi:hypothetical protein